MILLALDTATTTASAAIVDLDTDRLLAEQIWIAQRRHTQDLTPAIQRLLSLCQATVDDITALAVTTGPGSFTGVRIGISTVKGMGMGLGQAPKVIGIPTLSVTAAPWVSLLGEGSTLYAALQAGRGRYNWVSFSKNDLLKRPIAAEHGVGRADDLAQILAQKSEDVWLVGEVDDDLAGAVMDWPNVTQIDNISGQRRAGQLARLAAHHFAAGHADPLASLQPLYLREP